MPTKQRDTSEPARAPLGASGLMHADMHIIGGDRRTAPTLRALFGPSWSGTLRSHAIEPTAERETAMRAVLRNVLEQAIATSALPVILALGDHRLASHSRPYSEPRRPHDTLLLAGEWVCNVPPRVSQKWVRYDAITPKSFGAFGLRTRHACERLLHALNQPDLSLFAALDLGFRTSDSVVRLRSGTASPKPALAFPPSEHGFETTPIYWINLDRRPERRDQMETLLADWAGRVERIPAVDGIALSDDDLAAYQRRLPESRVYPERFRNAGELGCLRSHQKALRRAIEVGNYPFIIFEDDVLPRPDWWKTTPPEGWQIAVLGGSPRHRNLPVPEEPGWHRLEGKAQERWGTFAYAVSSKEAAQAALAVLSRESIPADHQIWDLYHMTTTYFALPPQIDADLTSSDTQMRQLLDPATRSDLASDSTATESGDALSLATSGRPAH